MRGPAAAALRRHARLLIIFVLLGFVYLAFERTGARALFSLEALQRTLAAHPLSGLVVFVAAFSLGNLVQVPGWLFLAAAVLTLGQLWWGVVTYVAASVSCVVTYGVVRGLGGHALRKLDSALAQRLLQSLDAHPVRSVVLLRLMFQTAPALNYTLALSGVRFRDYLTGTLFGLPLPITVYCLLFEAIAQGLGRLGG